MPYISREDGERFIIPSYRDTLSAKKKNLLKKEIVLLSATYGEYIALQKKTASTYEVAISPDSGYLLGECVWNYFKRPYDMIYCEEIPNSNEAILVIVKSGSVYLDGSFPVDSIVEELVIFKTQTNNFSIFISGNVPISETPEEGKFSFDASSVRSFSVLDTPVFPTLPGVKAFQLQLVDIALRAQGIGILPLKHITGAIVAIGLVYFIFHYFATHKKAIPVIIIQQANPYQAFNEQLITPDPVKQIFLIINAIGLFNTIPGWIPTSIDYTPGTIGTIHVKVLSQGARLSVLNSWAEKNNIKVDISPTTITLTKLTATEKRTVPDTITPVQSIITTVIDRMSYVLPGNVVAFTPPVDKKVYTEQGITITFASISPLVLELIGRALENLPLVLNKVSITYADDGLSGSISLKALGN